MLHAVMLLNEYGKSIQQCDTWINASVANLIQQYSARCVELYPATLQSFHKVCTNYSLHRLLAAARFKSWPLGPLAFQGLALQLVHTFA